jgi:hypothetical protein
MVQIATNTPSGLGRRSLSLSREARTLSMSREAVSNLNQCSRVGTDRDGAVSCGSKTLPWTAGMRKYRSFGNGLPNRSNRPLAEVPPRVLDRPQPSQSGHPLAQSSASG